MASYTAVYREHSAIDGLAAYGVTATCLQGAWVTAGAGRCIVGRFRTVPVAAAGAHVVLPTAAMQPCNSENIRQCHAMPCSICTAQPTARRVALLRALQPQTHSHSKRCTLVALPLIGRRYKLPQMRRSANSTCERLLLAAHWRVADGPPPRLSQCTAVERSAVFGAGCSFSAADLRVALTLWQVGEHYRTTAQPSQCCVK